MRETFLDPFSSDLTEAWKDLLEVQASLFAPKLIQYFANHGLSESLSPLLDLGCGTGAFTVQLKERFPSLEIIAADAHEGLLKSFRTKIKNKNYNNIKTISWKAGHEDVPDDIKNCKAVSLTLMLQHAKDPVKILSLLKDHLKSGTKIFIAEEDDGFFQIYPENKGFQKIFKSWGDYENHNLNSRYIGRTLPTLAKSAGLKVIHYDVLMHTQKEVGFENLAKFYLATYHMISLSCPNLIPKEEKENVPRDIQEYIANNRENSFLYYPQVVMVAEVK